MAQETLGILADASHTASNILVTALAIGSLLSSRLGYVYADAALGATVAVDGSTSVTDAHDFTDDVKWRLREVGTAEAIVRWSRLSASM